MKLVGPDAVARADAEASPSHGKASPFPFSLVEFSPFDLRFYLRLVAGLLAWKVLSTDYRALAALVHGVDIIPYQSALSRRLVHGYQAYLLGTEWKIVGIQIAAAAFLVLAAVSIRRWALTAGLLATLLVEWSAFQYRGYIWSFEIPLTVLAIMALWPVRWAAIFEGGRRPTRAAGDLGLAVALYFGLAYAFCGLSKVIARPSWFENFSVDLFYFGRNISKGPVPAWLEPVSSRLAALFADYPGVGEFSRLAVLGVELLWFTALFWRPTRRTLPYAMLAAHIVFFLQVGFTFIPFALSAVAVLVPWRVVVPGRAGRGPDVTPASSPLGRLTFAACLSAVALTVLYPVWCGRTVYPFSNFNVFGWSNRMVRDPLTFHHLAYTDPATGEVRRIPMQHGGFLDYTQWHVYAHLGQYYASPDPAVRAQALRVIHQFVAALRPFHSNAFLLGPLTMPDHVVCAADPVDPELFSRLRVLRYDYHVAERGLTPVITDLGPLPDVGTK